MGCHYKYDVQPGPTSETCPLEGHSETALVLRCQVSSESDTNFSIIWHHSKSKPDSNSITALISNTTTTVINTTVSPQDTRTSVISQLTLHGFDDKSDGYYWCSVDSNSDVQTHNPSVILHIVHNFHCKAIQEQYDNDCIGNISLYTASSSSRCADYAEISINVLEAQNCLSMITPVEEKPRDTSLAANPTTDPVIQTTAAAGQPNVAPITTSLHKTTTRPTPQETTSVARTSQSSMGVIIGASMGGLTLVLFIIIVLLVMCVVRMMKHKHRTREHRDDPTSPFDDIRMYSSIAKLTQDKVDDANRVSKLYCESNVSYECPHTVVPQPTENIYEYIN